MPKFRLSESRVPRVHSSQAGFYSAREQSVRRLQFYRNPQKGTIEKMGIALATTQWMDFVVSPLVVVYAHCEGSRDKYGRRINSSKEYQYGAIIDPKRLKEQKGYEHFGLEKCLTEIKDELLSTHATVQRDIFVTKPETKLPVHMNRQYEEGLHEIDIALKRLGTSYEYIHFAQRVQDPTARREVPKTQYLIFDPQKRKVIIAEEIRK